jgi:hypothetical protein
MVDCPKGNNVCVAQHYSRHQRAPKFSDIHVPRSSQVSQVLKFLQNFYHYIIQNFYYLRGLEVMHAHARARAHTHTHTQNTVGQLFKGNLQSKAVNLCKNFCHPSGHVGGTGQIATNRHRAAFEKKSMVHQSEIGPFAVSHHHRTRSLRPCPYHSCE